MLFAKSLTFLVLSLAGLNGAEAKAIPYHARSLTFPAAGAIYIPNSSAPIPHDDPLHPFKRQDGASGGQSTVTITETASPITNTVQSTAYTTISNTATVTALATAYTTTTVRSTSTVTTTTRATATQTAFATKTTTRVATTTAVVVVTKTATGRTSTITRTVTA
ncbi:hypothetical protein C8Q76DRAFT_860611 [Earliella scabrosa]|nr:hypothetical protein C8Q76DRAFT_860611 [Earliella scabrosa]